MPKIYQKHDTNVNSYYTYIKFILMAPIALVRSVCIFTLFNMCYIYKYFPNVYTYHPVLYFIVRSALFCMGFYYINYKNAHLIKQSINNNAIVVYNHISMVDILLLLVLYPFAIIGFNHGKICKIFVEASNGIIINTKAKNQTQKIIDHVNCKKSTLLIAPEGHMTNGNYILPFKKGAFLPLVPIQPVVLKYHYKFLNPFYGLENPYFIVYRLFTQIINFASVEVLPLVYPNIDETPEDFGERVRTIMANKLNIQKCKN